MNVTGIIAEYNPFHRGHKYQINYCRKELQADYVIVVMSGDYVQRGTPALLPKHLRAEMALRCGADLVLEMPVSVSTASAEAFAMGSVSILDSLQAVDQLCFGSEYGEVSALQGLAAILVREPEEYRRLLKSFLSEGRSFPAARSQALIEYFKNPHHFEGNDFDDILMSLVNQIIQILNSPNNILGIEYCKALLRLDSSIRPVTLKRQGMGYHETFPDQQTASSSLNFASASAIRIALKSGFGISEILRELPDNAALVLETAVNKKEFLLENDFSLLLQYCLLNETPESLICYADMSKDLATRIYSQINHFENFTQFTELLKTKELTYTRIQRALLHTILKVREQPKGIPYARVLGFRKSSSPLLKEIKQHTTIPVITKAADASGILSADGQKIWNDNLRASNIYESILAQKTGRPFVHEYQKQLVLL